MKKEIPFQLKNPNPQIFSINQKFRDNGFELFLVGGQVRDQVLGKASNDYDFTTNARPEQVQNLFPNSVLTGVRFGTVTIFDKASKFEITTYRKDGKYQDKRRPESVTFAESLKEDVIRRDFTVNSLAYDIEKQVIVDYFEGIEDIKKKIIQTVEEPDKRFNEDALRLLRACRFAVKLNFEIEEKTFLSIKKNHPLIKYVSAERIRDELVKIITSSEPKRGIEYLRQTGLLKMILPEFASTYGVEQNSYHAYDVYYHSLEVVENISPDKILRMAALLHDIGKPETKAFSKKDDKKGEATFYKHEIIGSRISEQVLKDLKFSKKEIHTISHLVKHHMFHYQSSWTDKTVKRFINRIGRENLDSLFQLRKADRLGKGKGKTIVVNLGVNQNQFEESNDDLVELGGRIEKILEQGLCLTIKDLPIGGDEVMKTLGLKPGPMVGEVLAQLLDWVLGEKIMDNSLPENEEKNSFDKKLLLNQIKEIYRRMEKHGTDENH